MTKVVAAKPVQHILNHKDALVLIDGGFDLQLVGEMDLIVIERLDDDGGFDLVPYPGWRWVPMFDGSWKHEKIEDAVAAPTDERFVDAEVMKSIRNIAIEDCARALEQEAAYNDKVAHNEKDFLVTRARAEQAAQIKRTCAHLLRSMKK